MKLLTMLGKLALGVVVAVVALTVVGKIRQAQSNSPTAQAAAAGEQLSPAGFFLLDRAAAGNTSVTVMVAPNCPRDEAVRGRALHAALQQAGIPCRMSSELQVSFTDPADAERVQKLMNNVANPLVLVRGWAKGNPSLQDVIAQYRGK